jgi:hypothetical protein
VSPRVREAEDALVRWKAGIIRARRWARFCYALTVGGIVIGGVEIVWGFRPVAGFIVLVAAFAAYARYELVFQRRCDVAKDAVVDALRALDYGDDTAHAASRSILQSMIDFEK